MWSVGCVLYEMLKGSALFDSKEKNTLLCQICSVNDCKPSSAVTIRYPVLNSVRTQKTSSLSDCLEDPAVEVSSEAMDLLQALLQFDASRRITPSDALKHKHFAGASFLDVQRTCPLQSELMDTEVTSFVGELCGGM